MITKLSPPHHDECRYILLRKNDFNIFIHIIVSFTEFPVSFLSMVMHEYNYIYADKKMSTTPNNLIRITKVSFKSPETDLLQDSVVVYSDLLGADVDT